MISDDSAPGRSMVYRSDVHQENACPALACSAEVCFICVSPEADRTAARPPKPTIRRTLSLDAIVGPYLQGHWPKDTEGTAVTCVNDKATQVRLMLGYRVSVFSRGGRHQREYPLMQCNGDRVSCVFQILDIPDGHRAPVPAQRCSSGSQSEPSPGPLDPSLLSPSQSPSEAADCGAACLSPPTSLPSFALDPPLLQPCSSSPRPNKTYAFQRQPPEGCERVRVCEEAMAASQDEPLLQPSCPDPNKVNFTPHGGSAFCPVSLLKPLLPSMDLLFRGLPLPPGSWACSRRVWRWRCGGSDGPTRPDLEGVEASLDVRRGHRAASAAIRLCDCERRSSYPDYSH
uniref:Family with sequence similarity 117 member Aa n=1 Tax=Salarias fasciatus TaxID=181472 RepID=A0A672HA13_SALFA